jgi:hypothetical protein
MVASPLFSASVIDIESTWFDATSRTGRVRRAITLQWGANEAKESPQLGIKLIQENASIVICLLFLAPLSSPVAISRAPGVGELSRLRP